MENKQMTFKKIAFISVICICLVASFMLSIQSVTGYIVSETVNSAKDTSALILFLSGLFGALIYLSKFR